MLIIIANLPVISRAQSIESEFHNLFNFQGSIMLLIDLIIIILLMCSIILYRNYKKTKELKNEINNFNKLRKIFIDADNRLVYLKSENLEYIFVNKAFETFYHKESSEIIGRDDFKLADKEFAQMWRKTDLEVLDKQTAAVAEVRWGNRIYKTNKFPIQLLNGKYGVGGYIEEVTEANHSKREQEKTLFRNAILVDVFSKKFDSSRDQLDYVLSKAQELTESKFGYIYLYDEENQEFILNSWSKNVMPNCEMAVKQTRYQLEKTGLWGEVVRQNKPIIINNFEMDNPMKKGYPEGHVKLSKFMTIPVVIDNKIVAVIGLANKVYDYDDNDVNQVTILMTGVWNAKEKREKSIELEETNMELKENKDKLQLILDSTAEAIYGIDKNGDCTFCNASCLNMLGYKHQDQLIGKNMNVHIHHSSKNARSMLKEQHSNNAFIVGKGTHGEVWRADGTSFDVEYFSYLQHKEEETIGTVVTFVDITERKKADEEIKYLSYHDALTGLYNRMFYEEKLTRLDVEKNLPISIIMGDVNGLKLTNDIFGHAEGDRLLKKIAEIFKKVCREDDISARVGGDEFVILLPNTEADQAEKIMIKIKEEFSKEQIAAIRGSIAMGCDTKVSGDQDMIVIIKNAENKMYRQKTLERKTINANQIKTIIDTLHGNSPIELMHSKNVSEISQKIGRAMNLTIEEIKRLKDAGFLHDIGKIVFNKKLINNENALTENDRKEIAQHPVVGYRILHSFDDTLDLAGSVLAHHERWDGLGYPKGLKGEEIPKLARIIAVAESYDAMTNDMNKNPMSKEEATQEIKKQSGVQFDPEIVNIFVKTIMDN